MFRNLIKLWVLVVAFTSHFAAATDRSWSGGTASYTNATLWTGGIVPGSTDNAIVDNGGTVTISSTDPAWTPGDMRAGNAASATGSYNQSGSSVTLSGSSWFRLGIGSGSTGNYIMSSGTVTIPGEVHIGESAVGTMTISGGTFTKNNSTPFGFGQNSGAFGTLTLSGSAVVNQNGGYTSIGWGTGGKGILNIGGTSFFHAAGSANNTDIDFNIGDVTSTLGIVNLSGGTLNTMRLFAGKSGTAQGYIVQTGGTFAQTTASANEWFLGGNISGDASAIGIYDLTNGIFSTLGNLHVGRYGSGGMFVRSNSSVTVGTWPSIGRQPGGFGVLDMTGGVLNQTGTNNYLIIAESGVGIMNMRGGSVTNSSIILGLNIGQNAGATGIVNLASGTINTLGVGGGAGSSTFNFNGGTLQARSNNSSFVSGLTKAYVYGGSGIIDPQSFTINLPQVWSAPTGNGVSTLPVSTAGSGYLTPPIVRINGGGGSGATAIATIANGSVSGMIVTCPGVDYTSAPTVTFIGGTTNVAATPGTPTLVANTSGGLRKIGTGTVILSGASAFTGTTTINGTTAVPVPPATFAGGLVLSNSIASGNIVIGNYSSSLATGNALLQLGFDNALSAIPSVTFDGLNNANYAYIKLMGRTLTVSSITQVEANNTGNTSALITNDGGDSGTAGQAGTLVVSNNVNNTFAGRLRDNTAGGSGTGGFGLIKQGSATLFLTGPYNTPQIFTKGTTIQAGTLDISGVGGTNFSSSSPITNSGGTFNLGAQNLYPVSALKVSGGTVNGTGSITITNTAVNFDLQAGTVNVRLLGGAGLVKSTAGTVTLSNTNLLMGAASLTGGTLALSGTSSISNTPSIAIGAGATLDVSGLSSTTFSLTASNSLRASGTGVTVGSTAAAIKGASGGTINLGSRPVTLTYDGANPALYISQGTLSLGGNAFTINTNTQPPLAFGSYTVIQQASGSIVSNAAFTVTGSAIASDKLGSLTVSGGNVVLTVTTNSKIYPTILSSPTASAISYGQTTANSSLAGGAATNTPGAVGVPGTFTFNSTSIAPFAGTTNVGITFTPTDAATYNIVTTNVVVTVNKTTPNLTLVSGSVIAGRAISTAKLAGSVATNGFNNSSVTGSFAFTIPSLIPTVIGTTNVNVTFMPVDSTNYNSAAANVNVVVNSGVLSIFGSSVAKGIGSSGANANVLISGGSYSNSWAALLTTNLLAKSYVITNGSLPGDTSAGGVSRFPSVVVPSSPNYVLVSYGLGNDNLGGTSDPAGTVAAFLVNLTNMVTQCVSNGYYPVVSLPYARNDIEAPGRYSYIQGANLVINTWNVPLLNFDGVIDDGTGGLIGGLNSGDGIHPTDYGHAELYYSIPPTIFEALTQGKTNRPLLSSTTNFARLTSATGVTAPIVFNPADTVHSYTMAFKARTSGNGTIAAIRTGNSYATLQITNGLFAYVATNGNRITASSISASNGDWHDIAISCRYALTNTWLFVDGVQVGSLSEQYAPSQFVLGGPGGSSAPVAPSVVDFKDWSVYRSAWNLAEAQAQFQGNLQIASMDIGAMLDDVSFASNSPAVNRAASLSVVSINTAGLAPMQSVSPPSNLAAASLAGSTIRLTWTRNSASENGFVIERRASGGSAWTQVATVVAGTTNYDNIGLTSGAYYDYRVAALEGGLAGKYSNVASAGAGIGIHQVMLVDFGPNDGSNGDTTTSPDWMGQYWNNMVGAGGAVALSPFGLANMVTTGNVATAVGLSSSGSGWLANGKLNGGLLTPSYSQLGNFAVTNATEDYFFTQTAASLVITNLDSSLNYRLRLFATRNVNSVRITQYITTGANGPITNLLQTSGGTWTNNGSAYNGNADTIVSVGGVVPNGARQIQLDLTPAAADLFAYLGIMEITANRAPVAQPITLGCPRGSTVSFTVVDGKRAPTDADGDGVTVTAVSGAVQGGGVASTVGGSSITYTADNTSVLGTNTFTYTVTDTFGSADSKTVTVLVTDPEGFNRMSPPSVIGAGTVALNYLGIPGSTYVLDWTTNLTPPILWTALQTNVAATNGYLFYTNSSSAPANFFRTRSLP